MALLMLLSFSSFGYVAYYNDQEQQKEEIVQEDTEQGKESCIDETISEVDDCDERDKFLSQMAEGVVEAVFFGIIVNTVLLLLAAKDICSEDDSFIIEEYFDERIRELECYSSLIEET